MDEGPLKCSQTEAKATGSCTQAAVGADRCGLLIRAAPATRSSELEPAELQEAARRREERVSLHGGVADAQAAPQAQLPQKASAALGDVLHHAALRETQRGREGDRQGQP